MKSLIKALIYRLFLFLSRLLSVLLLFISFSSHGETLVYLGDGNQFLIQILDTIDRAKKSLDLNYYIFRPCDPSSQLLIDKLEQKAKQGVKVRIVLDSWPNRTDVKVGLAGSLYKKGIELRFFNKKRPNLNINHRMHGKLLVADGQRYITGGRNISDGYFSLAKDSFIDRDVFVEGKSASQAQAAFDRLWNSSLTFSFKSATDQQISEFERTCFKKESKFFELQKAVENESDSVLAQNPKYFCHDVEFLMDDPTFWKSHRAESPNKSDVSSFWDDRDSLIANKKVSERIMNFISSTVSSFTMEVWGYIPTAEMNWALQKLRSEKIPILVVTNKVTDEGEAVSRMNQYYSIRDFKESQTVVGVSPKGSLSDRWSQTPAKAEWILHSKVFVSDEKNVAITSFNFDPRSYHTNIESGVFVRNCGDFAKHVLKEVNVLVDVANKDKSCDPCQKKLKANPIKKLTDWLQHELL